MGVLARKEGSRVGVKGRLGAFSEGDARAALEGVKWGVYGTFSTSSMASAHAVC